MASSTWFKDGREFGSALETVTRSLATEYAGGARNAVALGIIETPYNDLASYGSCPKRHPLAGVGEVSDVVEGLSTSNAPRSPPDGGLLIVYGHLVSGGAVLGQWLQAAAYRLSAGVSSNRGRCDGG